MQLPATPNPRFLLETETLNYGHATLRLIVRPVYLADDGSVRNYVSGFETEPLADLQINGQADYVSDNAYGWRVEYRTPYSVDLAAAEAMTKLLKRIDRGVAKIDAQLGRAESFGAYVLRVAAVLKVDQFGWKVDPAKDILGTGYRWVDADQFGYHVATIVSDFKREQVA
jgi:hypothetical protein